MSFVSRLSSLVRNLLRGPRLERDLDEEVRAYVELLVDEKTAAGLAPADARRAALVELGGVEPVKELTRRARAGALVAEFGRDVRYGLRALRRSPGFATLVVLVLALGIGANTAIFSVVHAVLLRPLPYPQPDRLVFAWAVNADGRRPFSGPDFVDFREQSTVYDEVCAFFGAVMVNVSVDGRPEMARARDTTHAFLAVYGLGPHLGRTFRPEEDRPIAFGADGDPDAPPQGGVAMISHGYWLTRFGGDPAVIGRLIRIEFTPYRIIGVTPQGFRPFLPDEEDYGADVQVWTLSGLDLRRMPRDVAFARVVGRLRPEATLAQARGEAAVVARRLQAAVPLHRQQGLDVDVAPLGRELTRGVVAPVLVLFGAVGCVLLIACANLVTLMLARVAARRHEIAVRLALGAGRGRVVRQLLTESLLASLLGATAGLLLAGWLVRLLPGLAPGSLPRAAEIGIDGPVLAFTLGAALAAALLVGLAPAIRFSRPEVGAALKTAGRDRTGAAPRRLDALLVVGEVALSLILVIGTALLVRSFVSLVTLDPGFRPDGVLTAEMTLSSRRYPRYPSAAPRVRLVRQIADRIARLPGVEHAGLALVVPLGRQDVGHTWATDEMAGRLGVFPPAKYRPVTPGYFPALGTRVLEGRDFVWADLDESRLVAIVDQRLARRAWPDGRAIGRRLRVETWTVRDGAVRLEPFWTEVVGVVENVRSGRLDRDDPETVYLPYGFYAVAELSLVVRGGGDPAALIAPLRAAVAEIDPDLAVFNVRRLRDFVADALAPQRFSLALLAAFGVSGLLLAVVGLYGLLSLSVRQRVHEIGVRMALGATATRVHLTIMGRGLALVGAGLGVGLIGAWALTRVIASQLYAVSPTDAATFAMVTALTCVVSLLACYLPARRATRIDPLAALRDE